MSGNHDVNRHQSELISHLIEGTDLASLNRLVILCTHTDEALSLAGLHLGSEQYPPAEINDELELLMSAFPELSEVLNPELIKSALRDAARAADIKPKKHHAPHGKKRKKTEKGKAKTFVPQIPDAPKEIIEARELLRSLSRAAIERIAAGNWGRIEKAEAFLENYVCDDPAPRFGDQEALIYLVSRGKSCKERIEKLIQDWRCAANAAIEESAKGHEMVGLDGTVVERFGQKSSEDARDVQRWPTIELRNFWGYHDREELGSV